MQEGNSHTAWDERRAKRAHARQSWTEVFAFALAHVLDEIETKTAEESTKETSKNGARKRLKRKHGLPHIKPSRHRYANTG